MSFNYVIGIPSQREQVLGYRHCLDKADSEGQTYFILYHGDARIVLYIVSKDAKEWVAIRNKDKSIVFGPAPLEVVLVSARLAGYESPEG